MTTSQRDLLEDLCRQEILDELTEIINTIGPCDVTAAEALAAIAVFRPAVVRAKQHKTAGDAPVLKLVQR